MTDCSAIANCCDFAGNYDLSRLPEIKKLEQAALGCDYGGTSWTTRKQVDAILEALQLDEASQLIDIGSGAGWPGLLLGALSNCQVTLLDIPLNALSQAAERAATDGMSDRVRIVAGSGTSLPFGNGVFDRVSHSDVLCCLPQKSELLKEARRVAEKSALMHFSVILPAEDLGASDHALVLETGPPFIGLDGNYSDMLQDAGWRVDELQDVTDEYKNSLQRLVDSISDNKAELENLLGANDLVAKREHREDQIELIQRGMMRREAYVATAT